MLHRTVRRTFFFFCRLYSLLRLCCWLDCIRGCRREHTHALTLIHYYYKLHVLYFYFYLCRVVLYQQRCWMTMYCYVRSSLKKRIENREEEEVEEAIITQSAHAPPFVIDYSFLSLSATQFETALSLFLSLSLSSWNPIDVSQQKQQVHSLVAVAVVNGICNCNATSMEKPLSLSLSLSFVTSSSSSSSSVTVVA